jgi:CheY-like chemotaxis protein
MARILIVDDEEGDRLFQSTVLINAGHEVRFAGDGESALAKWSGGEFDLVLTDLAMPRLNGLQLIQEIRRADPYARIIAISGVSADQLDLAEDYGAARSLRKPLDPRSLIEAIDAVLADTSLDRRDDWR